MKESDDFKSFIYYLYYLWDVKTKGDNMTDCHDMEKGQIYVCEDCGLELKVIKECVDCGPTEEECACGPCEFVCCGEELKLKP